MPPARASTAARLTGGCFGSLVLGVLTVVVELWILGRTDGRMMEQEPLLAFPPLFVALPVGSLLGAKAVDRVHRSWQSVAPQRGDEHHGG